MLFDTEIQIVTDADNAYRIEVSSQVAPSVVFRALAAAWDLISECCIDAAPTLSNERLTIQLLSTCDASSVPVLLGHYIADRLRETASFRDAARVVGWVKRSSGSARAPDPGSEADAANANRGD